MKILELQKFLADNPKSVIRFVLPDGSEIPKHFHVTEVGRVQKDFIDCGGTKRSSVTCLLQTWVAWDKEHRLDSSKLGQILKLAEPILMSTDLNVEVEYEGALVSQFQLLSATLTGSGTDSVVTLNLGTKHTACLAPDKCGVDSGCGPAGDPGCCGPGCC